MSKDNEMICWHCEKKFNFNSNDIVEYIDCEVGESPTDFVICPHCKVKQQADYNDIPCRWEI
jgi:uncharacterized Zn-finger protein